METLAAIILGPGNGTIPGTPTIQSKLTFKGDATYKVLINSNTCGADEDDYQWNKDWWGSDSIC